MIMPYERDERGESKNVPVIVILLISGRETFEKITALEKGESLPLKT